MGLLLNVDLETSLGPTKEAYITLESLRVNRALGEVRFVTTCWLTKKNAEDFYIQYHGDKGKNAIGLLPSNVIYYENEESDGVEVSIKNTYIIPLGNTVITKTPIYKDVKKFKEVPYVSFDEEGNELTLYKTVESIEKEVDHYNEEEKTLIDLSILDNISSFCYKHLRKELGEIFPVDQIETIQ